MKISIIKYLILGISICLNISTFAQGYLMLAGGGGESAGGWSDAPYGWVVEHAQNKRIAVITYDAAPTNWIPDYFKSFGAKYAKNFIIASKTSADNQVLYDSLITYDGVFIKGGDQAKYYEYYKGTKTQAALQYIYDHGGVLSGTSAGTAILSPIVYTAQIASVDPATALANAYSSQITLANDFLTTLPKKYIFDTHFNERGRFGRLPSFMASWYKKTSENAIGVGIGDHTALCIDLTGKAAVFGTGAVNFFYHTNPSDPYDVTTAMLRTKSMKFNQLLHGCTIDLNTDITDGLTDLIQPPIVEENARLSIFFSGTDYPSDEAYNHFVNQAGVKEDAILIVTGNDLTRANDAKSKLLSNGATEVYIIQAIATNQNDAATQENINKAKKIFVLANDYQTFMNFIKGGGNGTLLNAKFKKSEMISFFAGDNARFAGKTVVVGYALLDYPSYHGLLQFQPGLGLLKTTDIMPNTFINADTYENTVSGLPLAMVLDTVEYGLYLTGNTFAAYNYTPDGKSYFKNMAGNYPLIVLGNNGTLTGFANQGPYPISRNIAGFKNMNLKYLGISDTITVGHDVPLSFYSPQSLKMNIYPNPAKDIIHIQGFGSNYSIQISDIAGRIISNKQFVNNTDISLENYHQGTYLVSILDLKTMARFSTKLCVIK